MVDDEAPESMPSRERWPSSGYVYMFIAILLVNTVLLAYIAFNEADRVEASRQPPSNWPPPPSSAPPFSGAVPSTPWRAL